MKNDAEWEKWHRTWTTAEGPLPDIRARAARESARHRRASAVFIALLGAGCLGDLWALYTGGLDPLGFGVLVLWCALLGGVVLWILRRSAFGSAENPREALAFLERRARLEQQGAHLLRWVFAAGLLFTVIHFRGLFPPEDWLPILVLRVLALAAFVVTFSAPWWVQRFARKQQAEFDLWRRWLDEQQL